MARLLAWGRKVAWGGEVGEVEGRGWEV